MTEPSARMTCRLLPAAVVLAAALTGCAGGTEPDAAVTASPTSPAASAVSPTMASPSPSANPSEPVLKFGDTYTFGDGSATVTVYRYKHNATQFGDTDDAATVYSALDIKFCLKRLPDGLVGIEVSGYPWTLRFGDESYESTGTSGGSAMRPEYPEGRRVRVGACVRGWLDFEVPKGGELTEAQYAPDDGQATLVVWRP